MARGGVPAGTLSLEIVAEIGRLQEDMRKVQQSVGQMADGVGKSAKYANDNLASVTKTSGQARAGMQQLGYQLGDVATMFSMGAKPAQIFASQIGQVTQAVQMMSGGTSRLAAFLGGPWGIALSVGVIAMAPFIDKLWAMVSGAEAATGALEDLIKKRAQAFAQQNQLPNAQKDLDALVARRDALLADIEKRGVRNANGQLMFVYKQQQEVAALNKQIGEGRAAIDAERNSRYDLNKVMDFGTAATEKSTAATGRKTGATRAAKKATEELTQAEKDLAALRALSNDTRDIAMDKLTPAKSMSDIMGDMSAQDTGRKEVAGAYDEIATQELQRTLELMDAIAEKSFATADIMASAFGGVGDVIGGMAAQFLNYQAAEQEASLAVLKGNKTQKQADLELATLRSRHTADALRGVKSLFKEKSTAYKVMSGLEKAFALMEMANTVKSIALDTSKTATSVANSATRGAADQASGAAKIFSELGPWAFPVVAAMVALLASLGLGGGGSAAAPSIPSADELQEAAGTGSVLGDAAAKSASIANALAIVAENSNRDLEYSNNMLRALRSIDSNIGALAGNVAQQISVNGSMFDTSALRIGSSGSGGFLGIGGSSTTRSLYDLGLNLNSGTVADIIANGISGQTYQIVQQVKKKSGFFGIGGGTSTSYQTTTGQIDASIRESIVDVISSLRMGLVEASNVIGMEGAAAILDGFRVNLGKISFANMTGQEIEDQLNAIFSKVGDDMAGVLLPSLKQMQRIGEGLFETFIRVARQYQVIDTALASIGMQFGAVGLASVKARDELIQLFGALDEFVAQTEFFRDKFLTEVERIEPIAVAVGGELARLGLTGIQTREQFKQAVLGLDLSTAAGRETYAALLNLAPAFDKVASYAEDAAAKMTEGFRKTVTEFQGYANSLAKYRDSLRSGNVGSNSYAALRSTFMATADLAAQGDVAGLTGLESAGKNFLTAARSNAASLIDYQREVAMVANAVDQGVFAADAQVEYAQMQIDAINANADILTGLREDLKATQERIISQGEWVERVFRRWDGEGLRIQNDATTPVYTQVVA